MYIYQNNDWPNFTWDKTKLELLTAKVNRKMGVIEGKLSAIGFDIQSNATVEAITNDIVYSSEIEGVQLNTEEVRSSVARRMGVKIPNDTASSHYIEGIVEMMLDATTNKSPLTDERLFGWHSCLFPTGRSNMEKINVGKYRVNAMDVISGPLGREKVHYHAPEPENIQKEMKHFLDWFNSKDPTNDYIKSAIAHFWFVCIHPFDDGNGRIGRAIADMALCRAENYEPRYYSMSRQINIDKKKYYEVLEKCQKGSCDITIWIEWYLGCLLSAIENAEDMLSSILNKAIFWQLHSQTIVTERQKAMLNFYLDGYIGKLNAKKWSKQADVSLDSAARDIKDLVAKGILQPQEGRVRDVSYGICIGNGKIYIPGQQDE